jgi:hypothetical protein
LRVTEELFARGHPSIIAKHRTTFEITRDSNVTKRGDCILAVRATRGLSDLSAGFRKLCMNNEAKISVALEAEGIKEVIEGTGSSGLTLGHANEIVGRRSAYVSDRTLMVHADKAACDVNRDLINVLKSQTATVRIVITVEL